MVTFNWSSTLKRTVKKRQVSERKESEKEKEGERGKRVVGRPSGEFPRCPQNFVLDVSGTVDTAGVC